MLEVALNNRVTVGEEFFVGRLAHTYRLSRAKTVRYFLADSSTNELACLIRLCFPQAEKCNTILVHKIVFFGNVTQMSHPRTLGDVTHTCLPAKTTPYIRDNLDRPGFF